MNLIASITRFTIYINLTGRRVCQLTDDKTVELSSDIAPTAPHILSLPVPEDVDERVLIEAFEEKSELARREVKRAYPSLRRIARKARGLRAQHTQGGSSP